MDRTTRTSEPVPALEVHGLRKAYGAIRALDGVDLSVAPGEIVGLLGDNGAGKSTLVKCIAGSLTADTGHVSIDGDEVDVSTPEHARRAGIETVFQDLALVDALDVVENLHLNREVTSRWPVLRHLGVTDQRAMRAAAAETLEDLGIKLPSLRVPVGHLSGGQRQIVAVARSVMWGSRVLLMDEPAAALGVEQSRIVIDLTRRLSRRGLAIVFISHNMQEVVDLCDRAVVLRHGKVAGNVRIADADARTLVDLITGAAEFPGDPTADTDDASNGRTRGHG